MGKVGKMMADRVKGSCREKSSFKLNTRNRLAMQLEWIKVKKKADCPCCYEQKKGMGGSF